MRQVVVVTALPFVLGGLTSTAIAADSDRLLETVTVTAQKREERLQDVPVSVAVVSADSLGAFDLNQATDLAYLVPGVGVSNSAGPRSFGFFIRGVGTTSFASESIESSSAYVVDGVVTGQAGAALSDLPDIERIEVLRGPQGTLFGKNASSGVINVVTKRPSDTFGASLKASYSDPDNETKLAGYVTGPINNDVRYLVSARTNQRDGFVRNLADGRGLNDRNDWGVRARIDLAGGENLEVSVIADYWKREADCCIWTLRSAGTPASVGELEQIARGARFGEENDTQNVDGGVFSDVDTGGVSVQADYSFGSGYTFTSITAFRSWHTIDGLDTDNRPVNTFNINFADFKQLLYTQEFRVTSPKEQFIDYVAGAFYYYSDVESESRQLQPLLTGAFLNRIWDVVATTENMAVFGQANVNFTDDFRLIVGGRFLREVGIAETFRVDPVNNLNQAFGPGNLTDEAWLWRVGLQYDLSDDVSTFVTATRGYKGGGWNAPAGASLLLVEPEKPTNYEIGLRSVFADAGLMLNVTGFYQTVDDYQVTARQPENTGAFLLLNAAEVLTKGVEVEMIYRPVRATDLSFTGSLAYTDGKFDSFPTAPCYRGQTAATGCNGNIQDMSGKQLPYAPEWNASLNTHYGMELGGSGLDLLFDLGVSYRTEAPANSPDDPSTYQDGYPLINAAVTLASSNDRWRVSFFGKNLTDERFATRIFTTPSTTGVNAYAQYVPYEAQRVVGLSLEMNY
jgi:iron complex outermembrane recepter protein